MPARLSSMELSSPSNPDVDPSARPSRRKSGREIKQTEHFRPSPSAKRKRSTVGGEDGEDHTDTNDESASDANDGDPDEEELREQRRKKRKAPQKPAAKKQKPNGVDAGSTTLARRPAKKAARPKKGAAVANAEEVGGLYGTVFGGDDTLDAIAADWLERFEKHESSAVAEIINLVLRCAGCEGSIDHHDVEDPDNCTNRLTDLQDEHQAQQQADYPLISRNKGTASFRKTMTDFFNTFIHTIAAKGVLTGQVELIENIESWIAAMSSARNRPFRHTATLVSLEITLALAQLGRAATDGRARLLRQIEGEKKTKRVNQTRVKGLESQAKEVEERSGQINTFMNDWFEAVFVNRYRDVDPRVRAECVHYLSEWVVEYPEEFLDGAHLRYLGWILSDEVAATRLQVARDIQKIYSDDNKIAGIRQFTERFRSRMVEMATRDSDLNVRCSCIELLDILRDKGLLEPDDVDTIGRLIFDNEPRVRKAVAPFFAANVEDMYQVKVDDFENVDADALKEFEQNENDDDFESHSLDWVRFKCITELLRSYDYGQEENIRILDLEASIVNDALGPAHSRISLAAQALFEQLPVLRRWETLAGYLLKDVVQHDKIGDSDDIAAYIENTCLLESAEESVLLDVLNVSVKQALMTVTESNTASKKVKKTKKELQLVAEAQEAAAQRLATLIPRLLKKFGSQPDSASAVLRLEHVLNLDVFAQLREDSTTYADLLEDINKQFMTHESTSVIQSAKHALLHAKSFEELQEVTEGKLSTLWDDTTLTLTRLCSGEEAGVRGNWQTNVLQATTSTLLRIANLSSISDPTDSVERTVRNIPSKSQRQSTPALSPVEPITCLLRVVSRGVISASDPILDEDEAKAEDVIVDHALKALTFYFMWRISYLRSASGSKTPRSYLDTFHDRYITLQTTLRSLISSRRSADTLRIKATETMLELTTLFSTLRHTNPNNAFTEALDLPGSARLPTSARKAVLSVFTAVERDYAHKANKLLQDPADEDITAEDQQETQEREREELEADPESSDDEDDAAQAEDEEDEDAVRRAEIRRQKKQRGILLAEQTLCSLAGKIVLALVGGCIDDGGVTRRRLERNVGRLGRNFAEVVGTLSARKGPEKVATRATKSKQKQAQQPKKSKEFVEIDDEIEEEIEEDGEEDLRRRELDEGIEDAEGDMREDQGGEVDSVVGD